MRTGPPDPANPSDRLPIRRRVAFEAWLANLVLALWVARSFAAHGPEHPDPRALLYLWSGLLSTLTCLSLLPGAATALLARIPLPRGLFLGACAFLWTLFQILLLADARVYGLFRYHFNGMVWNVLTTPGSEDAVHLDGWLWTRVGLIATAIAAGETAFLLARASWLAHRPERPRARRILRPATVWGFVLIPVILTEKTLFAYADLARDGEIVALSRLFPFYPRLKVTRFVTRTLGIEVQSRPSVALAKEGVLLRYPIVMPRLDAGRPRPNIALFVVESLRADMLSPEVMPNVWRFAQDGCRFEDHLSGGNASRFGVFSLLYGLHGAYWMPIYYEHRSPVLVDALLQLGYEVKVLATASMSYPEFRSTAWVRVEDAIEEHFPREEGQSRDAGLVRRFAGWLREREGARDDQPYFVFAFLDAPHQTYNVPAEGNPFEPYAREVDYLTLSGKDGRARMPELFNRYKNSVFDADRSLGAMITALEETGELDETLVVITGDHGEEFYENGFWGHTSNFTAPQVRTPLVLRGPNVPVGVETRPTSGIDVAPTLLECLGADPAERANWCQGESLLDPPPDRLRIVAGWEELGLWTPNGILVLPIASYGGDVEVRSFEWTEVRDDRTVLEAEGGHLARVAEACRRFLR